MIDKTIKAASDINQRNIITVLCWCQLSVTLLFCIIYIFKFHVLEVTLNVIFCFVLLFTLQNYYFMMGLLTIDRFIVFYPNLRYRLYVTSTKVIKLIISTCTIFLATTITFSVLIAAQKINFHGLNHRIFVLFLIIDFANIFLTVAILYLYLYIFIYIYIYIILYFIFIFTYSWHANNNQEWESIFKALRVKITLTCWC